MPEEQTIETPDLLQVDGAKILLDLGSTISTPTMPITLESLFQLITTHEHKGSDGSQTLYQGRIKVGDANTSAGGTQTITHDLNAVPKIVLIFAVGVSTVNGIMSFGYGKGIASGESAVWFSDNSSSSYTANRIVEVRSAAGTSLTATLARLSPTDFDLSWTLSGSLTARYLWITIT